MKPLSEEEQLGICYHEAGHAAVAWFFGSSLHTYDIFVEKWGGRFQFPTYQNGNTVAELIENSSEEALPLIRRNAEAVVIRLWAGLMAERRRIFSLFARGEQIPSKIILIRREYGHPKSDSSRIRDLLCGLGHSFRTKAGRAAALRLQNESWDIISEAKTWEAIQALAVQLMNKKTVKGEKVEEIFGRHGAPQTTESW